MKPQILRGLRFLLCLVATETLLRVVSCCLWCRWRSKRRVWTSAGVSGAVSRRLPVFPVPCGFSYWAWPLCVPVGGGPHASRPRCEPSARRVASNPGQAPPPPTGTAADPFGALHTSGAGALMYGSVRRLEARPGPAAAHGHRGRSLRRPPHRRRCVAGVWLGASARSPARPRASKRSLSSVSHAIP